MQNKADLAPCPACPDGYVWTANGPTAKCCPVCKGHAALWPDGTTLEARPVNPVHPTDYLTGVMLGSSGLGT